MRLPQPSTVISTVALFVACTGSATAAAVITGKQIKNNTITSSDVRNSSLKSSDVRNSSLTGKDIRDGSIESRDLGTHTVRAAALDPETVKLMNSTLTTTRVSRSEPIVFTPGDYNPSTLSVSCPDGQVALGGGGGLVNNVRSGRMAASKPVLDAAGAARGWEVTMGPEGTQNNQIQVFAVCSPVALPVG